MIHFIDVFGESVLPKTASQGVKGLLNLQVGLMIGMTALCAVVIGQKAAYSAFLAGFCCVLATLVFVVIAFEKQGATKAREIVRSFYRAEAVKWFVTALLMLCVFVFVPIHAGAFFITFCVMQLSYWAVLGLFKN